MSQQNYVQLDPPIITRRVAQLEAALIAAEIPVPPFAPESQTLLDIIHLGKLADKNEMLCTSRDARKHRFLPLPAVLISSTTLAARGEDPLPFL